LDFEEIESDLSDTFDDILVILKSPVQAEISKRASQLLSHSIFDDGITPGVFGPQLELPKFARGYAKWYDFYSTIIPR